MSDAGTPARDFPSVMAIAGGYGLNVRTYSPHDGGYLLEASEGRFWLKPFAGSEPELHFVVAANEHVRARGFTQLCRSLRLPDGAVGVRFRQLLHYVIELPPGAAPELSTIEGLQRTGELLAQFHLAARDFVPPPEVAELRTEWASCDRQFKERLLDLYDFQEICYDRTRPTRFDQEYIDRFNEFVDVARAAISMVADLPLTAMVAVARRDHQLCHGAFAPQSLASDDLGNHVITDLELVCYDLKTRDLADLIRAVADWDAERAIAVLRGYLTISPLTAEDLRLIQAILLFPREYWRAARAYYRDGVNTRANINEAVAAIDTHRRLVDALEQLSLPSLDWEAVAGAATEEALFSRADEWAPPAEALQSPAARAKTDGTDGPPYWWETPLAVPAADPPAMSVPIPEPDLPEVEPEPVAERTEAEPAAEPKPFDIPSVPLSKYSEPVPLSPDPPAPRPIPMPIPAPIATPIPESVPAPVAVDTPVVAPPTDDSPTPIPLVLPPIEPVEPANRPTAGKLVWRFPPPLPKRPTLPTEPE